MKKPRCQHCNKAMTYNKILGIWEYRKEKYDRCLRNAGIWFAILASLVAVIEATIAIIKVAE